MLSCMVPANEAVASKATETRREHAKKVSMDIAGTLFVSLDWGYAEHACNNLLG